MLDRSINFYRGNIQPRPQIFLAFALFSVCYKYKNARSPGNEVG